MWSCLALAVASSDEFTRLRPDGRVLYMSGYTGQTPGGTALPEGSCYLQKPFTQSTLLQKVQEALNSMAVAVS